MGEPEHEHAKVITEIRTFWAWMLQQEGLRMQGQNISHVAARRLELREINIDATLSRYFDSTNRGLVCRAQE